jgi:Tfp pilus assembly protein PilE
MSTPYNAIGSRLASLLGHTWPNPFTYLSRRWEPRPDQHDESSADASIGLGLLRELHNASIGHQLGTRAHSAALAAHAAALEEYHAAVAARAARITTMWSQLDASARSAETQILRLSPAAPFVPSAPTTPDQDIEAVVTRARDAATFAGMFFSELSYIRTALELAADQLELAAETVITPPVAPVAPTTNKLLLNRARRFAAYLEGS